MIDRVVVAAYGVTILFGVASLAIEAKLNDRSFEMPPREEWEKLFDRAKEETSNDIEELGGKSLKSVFVTVIESILILSLLLRTGIHSIAHLLGSGGKEPEWVEVGLVKDPVGPRPLWNDVTARISVFIIAMWWSKMLPSIDPAIDPRLRLVVLLWLGANAVILFGDPLIPVIQQAQKHRPIIDGKTLTNRS